jgi:hypothetical protein
MSTIGGYTQSINNVFIYDELNTLPQNMIVKNDSIYITGYYVDTSLDYGIKTFSSLYNRQGQILNNNFYRPWGIGQFVSSWYYGKLCKTNKGYIQAGYAADSGTGNYSLLLTTYNFESKLLNYYTYPTLSPSLSSGINAIQTSNNEYYITGIYKLGSTGKPFLLKADSNGTKIWIKYYNSVLLDFNAGASIIEDDSGHIVIAVISETEYNPPIMHLRTNKTTILNIDTAGTLRYARLDTSTIYQVGYSLQKTKDNNYISCGHKITYRDSLGGYTNQQGCIIKWDSLYNKIWTKDYYHLNYNAYIVLYDIQELADGSIIGCGYAGVGNDSVFYGICGWLIKTDREGNLIWSRAYQSYKYSNYRNKHYLYDIDVLSNGDIVAVGYVSVVGGDVSQQGWMIRVDSNGCLYDSNWCGYNSIEVEPKPMVWQAQNELRVYPNPASDIINVEVSRFKYQDLTEIKFEIYDAIGINVNGLCHSEAGGVYDGELHYHLNMNELSNGIYFIRILDKENKVIGNGKFVKE